MELVASSKLRRAKERVEGSRPYFETLYSTLYDIVSADSGFDSPYLVKRDTNRRLYIVIAGDRGLAGGYNSNILKAIERTRGRGLLRTAHRQKAVEHFERRKAAILTTLSRRQGICLSAIALRFPASSARNSWQGSLTRSALVLRNLSLC